MIMPGFYGSDSSCWATVNPRGLTFQAQDDVLLSCQNYYSTYFVLSAGYGGDADYYFQGNITIADCSYGITADAEGGDVYLSFGLGMTFTNNKIGLQLSTGGQGCNNVNVNMQGTLLQNHAETAIKILPYGYCQGVSLSLDIYGSIFEGNAIGIQSVRSSDSGMSALPFVTTITQSYFINNTQALNLLDGTLKVETTDFEQQSGGTVVVSGTTASLDQCTLRSNSGTNGGCISASRGAKVNAQNSVFQYNNATDGGVAWVADSAVVYMQNVTISGNSATTGGAAFCDSDQAQFFCQGCTEENNVSYDGSPSVDCSGS